MYLTAALVFRLNVPFNTMLFVHWCHRKSSSFVFFGWINTQACIRMLHASLKAKKNQEEATNYTGLSNSPKFSLYIILKPQGRKIIIKTKKLSLICSYRPKEKKNK